MKSNNNNFCIEIKFLRKDGSTDVQKYRVQGVDSIEGAIENCLGYLEVLENLENLG